MTHDLPPSVLTRLHSRAIWGLFARWRIISIPWPSPAYFIWKKGTALKYLLPANMNPTLDYCWAIVVDGWPAVNQLRANVSCLICSQRQRYCNNQYKKILFLSHSANSSHLCSVGLMVGHRLWCWSNINPISVILRTLILGTLSSHQRGVM